MTVKKVILATDGSENSLRAAAFTGQLLANNPNVEITIAFVASPPAETKTGFAPGFVPDIPLDVIIRRNAGPLLASTESALDLPGATVKSEVLVGGTVSELVTLARSIHADLIVCGRRGLSSLKELFLGSVSNGLVHSAPCSVLVVQ